MCVRVVRDETIGTVTRKYTERYAGRRTVSRKISNEIMYSRYNILSRVRNVRSSRRRTCTRRTALRRCAYNSITDVCARACVVRGISFASDHRNIVDRPEYYWCAARREQRVVVVLVVRRARPPYAHDPPPLPRANNIYKCVCV